MVMAMGDIMDVTSASCRLISTFDSSQSIDMCQAYLSKQVGDTGFGKGQVIAMHNHGQIDLIGYILLCLVFELPAPQVVHEGNGSLTCSLPTLDHTCSKVPYASRLFITKLG